MPIVFVDVADRYYPKVHLQKVSNSSVALVKKNIHHHTLATSFTRTELALDQIERMTIISRQRRFKTNIMGAVGGGVLGYIIGSQFKPEPLRQVNIEVINQPPQNGFMEPILGSILGLGLGMVIGDLFTPVTIDHFNKNPKQSLARLREITGDKASSRKKKKR